MSNEGVETRVFEVPEKAKAKAYIKSIDEYKEMYKRSIEDPEGFWAEQAETLDWFEKWTKIRERSLNGQ